MIMAYFTSNNSCIKSFKFTNFFSLPLLRIEFVLQEDKQAIIPSVTCFEIIIWN